MSLTAEERNITKYCMSIFHNTRARGTNNGDLGSFEALYNHLSGSGWLVTHGQLGTQCPSAKE